MAVDLSPALAIDGRVATITLRDPMRRNALDERALAALLGHVRTVGADDSVDVLLLAGEGAAFCAGFDLAACAEEPRRVEPLLLGLSACVAALRTLDIPVIARVQGAALAGGCALLTACDFVVAADDAQLGYPTHRIGISPAVSIPSLFSRMGPAARALALSNEIIDGRAAYERGLTTHVVPEAALDGECGVLLRSMLSKGRIALRETKRWIRAIEERQPGDLGPCAARGPHALEAARDASLALAGGEEFASMLKAFWEGRARSR